jgi:aminoglycoside phosphotransferase (APT) family kinase protein
VPQAKADQLALPLDIGDVSAAWLTQALSVSRPGVVVEQLQIGEVIHGSATKVWLLPQYNALGRSAGLPETMVLKTGFDPVMRQLAALAYARETLFFTHAAPTLDLPLPRCYFAGTDADSGQSALLLEDLRARGCRFGSILDPLDVQAVAGILDLLARLHAGYWNRTDAPELEGFDRNEGRFVVCDFLLGEDNWNRCLGAPRARDVPAPIRDRERVSRALLKLREYDRRAPACLIHGDAHVGNLYFEPDGAPRLLDWQAAMIGAWDQDVAYAITCALSTEDRRAHERELLKHYLDVLRTQGADPVPAFDEAWTAYRRQVAYGILGLLCTPQMQTDEFARIMGTRFAVAMDDLDSLRLLGQ